MIYLFSNDHIPNDQLKKLGCKWDEATFHAKQGTKSHYDFTRLMFDFVYPNQTWGQHGGNNKRLVLLESDVPLEFFLLSNTVSFDCILKVDSKDFLTDDQKLMMYKSAKLKEIMTIGVSIPRFINGYSSDTWPEERRLAVERDNTLRYVAYLKRKEKSDKILQPRVDEYNNVVQQITDSFNWIIQPKLHKFDLADKR